MIYVSPKGTDGGDGSEKAPFATLERARDEVRVLKKSKRPASEPRVTVILENGAYTRTNSLKLGVEDSGTEQAPVVWKARVAGAAVLDAGVTLPVSRFHRVEGADAERLAPEAKNQVWWVDLADLGVRHLGPYPVVFDNGGGTVELFFNGERQSLSRWPKEGPARMEKVLEKGLPVKEGGQRLPRFVAREDRVGRWSVEQGVWLEGYWRTPWDPRTVKVDGIQRESREVTLAVPVPGGIGSKYAGPNGSGMEPWWAVNLLEEIDMPGEWSLDFNRKRLFWWPLEGWREGTIVVSDLGDPVIQVEKAQHLRVEGLVVEHGLSHGIEVRDSRFVEVVGCTLRNHGGSGVVVQRGENNVVRSCDLSELGQSGITLSGGDRASLLPSGHVVENNHIQKVGVLKKTYAPGILVGAFGTGEAVGCKVRHNFIHDVPHAGVQYGGNEHVFEFNEVAHAVLTSDDMGAFYSTNDWTSCGNILRYNFVHNSPNAVGFYLDDGDGGDTVYGNLAYAMQAGPSVCGGHYNWVSNNLSIGCARGLFVDARGVARQYGKESTLFKKLMAVPFRDSPWKEHYPFLLALPDSDTRLPQGNVVTGNVVGRCEKPIRISAKTDEIAGSTVAGNADLADEDPGFVDEKKGDLRLRPESPVWKAVPDFQPLPFERMGLYVDAFRKTLPERLFESTSSIPRKK